MSTTTTTTMIMEPSLVKFEDDADSQASAQTVTLPAVAMPTSCTTLQPLDPKDPEGFLRRCSGHVKKKGVRCSATIGRNSHCARNQHPTFLPTCHAHKDQQKYAGWCQLLQEDGQRCGKLFQWTPPYFELCEEHQGHPDTPCYFLNLPLELRLDIFRYLLPSKPIGSSTSLLHLDEERETPGWHTLYAPGSQHVGPLHAIVPRRGQTSPLERAAPGSVFPTPLMDLLLVNRQMHAEVKDCLYSTVPFTVDVRKDGTFMCGRRLLEPRRPDGSSHFIADEVDSMKSNFIRTFDWAAVKNYNVDILVENWLDDTTNRGFHMFPWDEEVELYDIRDYVGVVVSGILSKSSHLCKLNVRLGTSRFTWDQDILLKNIKTLVGPFVRLRNVRQPRFLGVYDGTPHTNFMISLPLPTLAENGGTLVPAPSSRLPTPLCSVPQLPVKTLLRIAIEPAFMEYRAYWERRISSTSPTSLIRKAPIRAMFTDFKEFFSKLAAIVPDVMSRNGRHAFLHRARVAREQEDIVAFRLLRNELIEYWWAYLEQEERKKDDMNARMARMLDADVYPASSEGSRTSRRGSGSASSSAAGSSAQSPVVLDADKMHKEGIPMQGNVMHDTYDVTMRARRHSQQQRSANMQLHAQAQMQAQARAKVMAQVNVPFSKAPTPLQEQMQQALTLNPPTHVPFSAPLRHRGAEHLTQREILMQEARQRAAAAARLETQKREQQHAFSPSVAHAQNIAMPAMPMQQQLHQNIVYTPDEDNSWPAPITSPTHPISPCKRPSIHVDTPSPSSAKRPRVAERGDSGVAWIDDGRREVNENGDEVMVVTERGDPFRGWAQQCSEGVIEKGKERASASAAVEGAW